MVVGATDAMVEKQLLLSLPCSIGYSLGSVGHSGSYSSVSGTFSSLESSRLVLDLCEVNMGCLQYPIYLDANNFFYPFLYFQFLCCTMCIMQCETYMLIHDLLCNCRTSANSDSKTIMILNEFSIFDLAGAYHFINSLDLYHQILGS